MMAGSSRCSRWLAGQSPLATDSLNRFVYVESPSEVVVTVRAGCTGCALGRKRPGGRRAARAGQRQVLAAHPPVPGRSAGGLPHRARDVFAGPLPPHHRARSGAERARRQGACRSTSRRIELPRQRQVVRLHRAIDGADPVRAAEHGRRVHRRAAADVVRDRTDAARMAVPLFGRSSPTRMAAPRPIG